jgi:hypothetical protein
MVMSGKAQQIDGNAPGWPDVRQELALAVVLPALQLTHGE